MELSDHIPLNLICLAVLGVLGLRRLVRMDRYHRPRVVILTGLLWLPVLYVFLSIFIGMLSAPDSFYCIPPDAGSNVYPTTET